MADATLTDVVKKLGGVESAVKAGEVATGAERIAASEAAAEAARTDAKRMGIFQDISDKLNIFKGMKGDDKKAKGFFSSLLGGFKWAGLISGFGSLITTGLSTAFTSLGTAFGPKLIAHLTKLGPWALIISGLAIAVEDGITGWLKAEDWGTSKVSGFFGAFFGGTGSGITNAFKNAGKWALIGAGVGGLIGLLPGAIIGGLLGAAFGGILGYIGGETLAKSFDGIGAWFYKQFETLVLGPIKAVWDFIAPDWAKAVTDKMVWSDLLPPGLAKLFNGEYFTFDMPTFSWTDLFPKFLVDLFNNVVKVSEKQTWSWMDLLPPFLTKFFTGEYAPGKQEFKWQDLVPEFIWKVIEVAKTAWADTPFTWRSLVPNFILKIIDATTPIEGSFSWTDLVPKFITDLVTAGAEKATETGTFSWKALLPDWMVGAYDSTIGLAMQAKAKYFEWKSLLPEWIQGYLTTAEGGVSDALGKVSAFNWKSLLPTFIQDFIDDPTQLAKENYKFSWKSLLPEFIVNLIEGKPIFGGTEEGGSDELATGIDLSKINIVDTILKSVMQLVPESFLGVDIRKRVAKSFGLEGFKEGGFASFTGPAMVHGTLQKPEFVLDNQATAVFLRAAELLTGSQVLEQNRNDGGGGAPVIINNNNVDNSMQSSQTTAVSIPAPTRSNESTLRALQAA